jgi:hypothetical protein
MGCVAIQGISSGIITKDFKAGLKTAAIAAATVGASYGIGELAKVGSITGAEQVGLHMLVGGASSRASGGSFWRGAASSFAANTLPGKMVEMAPQSWHSAMNGAMGHAMMGAMVGGTTAVITGGGTQGFVNGAMTGAMQQLFNDFMHQGDAQKGVTYAELDAHYPKDTDGNDMYGPDVYKMVGGEVYDLQQENGYANACALRVSVALNGAGAEIPDVAGTFKGADGKNYFLSAGKLEAYMTSIYGTPSVYTSDFSNQLQGKTGIYIMRPNYPGQFGASGHATLFNGNDCVGGHCYFNATGGTHKVSLWSF